MREVVSRISCLVFFFFFQAEDGIRDVERSRGLGDVYKRQPYRAWTAFKYDCFIKCEKSSDIWMKFRCAKGSVRHITSRNVEEIKRELRLYGPVMAQMNVYLDFIYHKTGVYTKKSDHYLGRHAVRCYGYGIEDSTPYWQCSNTWSYNWGETGIFKIAMGECGIENDIWACDPDKPSL
eukprot:TRINITY_DN7641_c0_g1_i5.p1 TRINITY_DN7641_c0_g1~~TRINITY_DN7641_c0_g1_i5.p1  ORF type:complete len:178 (-),score=25.48 TRINITY_DN7641_c0_g1_i5:197-730(-)